jgi:acylphosphatase
MVRQIIVIVRGKVQGVFFRVAAQQTALKLDLTGCASNASNGTVQIIAEGEEDDLEKLVNWCQTGSPFAKVERVEVEWKEALGCFKDFMVQ